MEFKTINGPEIFKGITDLKSIYAFHGASQGDESQSNNVKTFKQMDGWWHVSFYFKDIDYLNQEEVNKRSNEIKLENDKYIQSLKDSVEYGKSDGHIKVTFVENPLLDRPKMNQSVCSYTYDIYDFSK